jgi:pSer/pThr/pTyr-binding forkhead associated (FHA) protein
VDNTPEYYCDPNQLVEGIKGCGYIGAMAGNICPECGGLWENPIPASQAHKTVVTPSQTVPPDLSPDKPVETSTPDIHQEPTQAACPMLLVEGNQTVLYEGSVVSEIPFDVDELSIGCRDTEQGHYPDIDLLKYRLHDPYLSRKHATFFKEEDKYFIKVLSEAESTGFNNKLDIIEAGERREIKTGDRIFFSDSIVITLK